MNDERGAGYARVEMAGVLIEWEEVVASSATGRPVTGLTGTVAADGGRYGETWHVTFPPTRDLDLWVAAVGRAWREGEARRAARLAELPAWMRTGQRAPGLRVRVWGSLRCGKPLGRAAVRPATVLAERAEFPGLDADTICRAEALWRAAQRARPA